MEGGGLNCPPSPPNPPSPRLSKTFFRVLFKLLPVLAEFFYSNFYQSLLISIHFCLACKLASVISVTKSLFVFTFLIMFGTFLIEINYLTYKKEVAKQRHCIVIFPTPFWRKLILTLIFNMCITYLVNFVIIFLFLYSWKVNWYYHFCRYFSIIDRWII